MMSAGRWADKLGAAQSVHANLLPGWRIIASSSSLNPASG